MADLAKLVDELSALTVMEAADLPLLLPVLLVVLPLLKKKTNSQSFLLKLVLTRLTLLKKSVLSLNWA